MYVVTAASTYLYKPKSHGLSRVTAAQNSGGGALKSLQGAALHQGAVGGAPAVFVVAADYSRTEEKYGTRAERYVKMEAGHAAQNLLLQATALGLGGVPIGAFYDEQVQDVLGLPEKHEPLYLIPVGRPA